MAALEIFEKMKKRAWPVAVVLSLTLFLVKLLNDSGEVEIITKSESGSANYLNHQTNNCTASNITKNAAYSQKKWKLFVPGSTWFNEDKDWNEYLTNCEHKCIYSPDPRLLPLADSVLFHYNLPWETVHYNFTVHGRQSHQRFISFTQESPLSLQSKFGTSYKDSQINFYNWTLSYRSNQKAAYPYGRIVAANSTPIEPARLRNITSGKKTTAIWLASHCETFSKRELIVQMLLKHNVKIDVWGECGNKDTCPRNEEDICEQKIESDYFFILAFENSICTEYVTEKLWHRAKRFYSVPVVLNRKIAEEVGFPGSGLIAVDDFATVSELGDFLVKLQRNLTEYERYFDWKSQYEIVAGEEFAWCSLCARLWDDTEPKSLVHDAAQIFHNISECFIPNWI